MASLKDDYWTTETINLLVEKRIAKDAIFKQTNSDRLGWLQVVADLKKEGASMFLNRINVRKQWFKICELYKESLEQTEENMRQELLEIPYYAKLKKFFDKNIVHSNKSKHLNQEYRNKITARMLQMSSYSDRWTVEKTDALIDARIARHSMFKGRGYTTNAWKAIAQDVADFDPSDTIPMSVAQVKKKWENLLTKFRKMQQSENYNTKWPHFNKMNYFYNEIYNGIEENYTVNVNSSEKIEKQISAIPVVSADKWPPDRTYLLIKRRIARDSMFGRGTSSSGWQAVLNDLILNGASKDLSIANVKKKWENLLTRHKIIKNSGTENIKWHYFTQMEKYHKMKKTRRRSKIKIEKVEDILKHESVEEKTEETNSIIAYEKLNKCRLCQQNKGDCSLTEDKYLCDQILKCTSINVCEDIESLPSSICESCKISIENFHKFLLMCEDVNKDLKSCLEQAEKIKVENSEESILESTIEDIENSPEEFIEQEIHDTETLECPECPASFTCVEPYEIHLKSHKNSNTKFHCEICNMEFMKQSSLFVHIKQHFEISNIETVDIDMENVEIEFLEEDNEVDSANCDGIVVPDELFHCELCSKNFISSKSLKEHFDSHSRIEHHCPRENCNKKFSSLNSLRQHEMRHLGLNSFLCTACGKGFVTINALKMHEKIHSEVKEHICEICSRGFTVLSNLKAHQKKHHEGHRFYCSQCPRNFLTKSSLQRHELVHTGIKEFVCDICSSAFFTLKELKKHKRYHEGIRLYHCSECYKTFFEKHHLTIHMRSHTGERPYVCKITGCKKSFKEKQKLQRHEKSAHFCK